MLPVTTRAGSVPWGLGGIGGSTGLIQGCTFRGCYAVDEGACLSVGGGRILLTGCLFESNSSNGIGALVLWGNHAVVDTVFRGNHCGRGSALTCGGGASVRFCSFIDNTAANYAFPGNGVGAGVVGDGSTVIQDSLFLNNTAGIHWDIGESAEGAAIYAPGGLVQRCTFVGNECYSQVPSPPPGATVVAGTVEGCIFLNETPFAFDPSVTTVSYSLVPGGMPGSGNITGDPLFWNPAAEDFHLRPGSPCIDTGDPGHPLGPNGSQPDMGAFFHDPTYYPVVQNFCTAKTSAAGCVPAIALSGVPSLGASFAITASGVDVGRFGVAVLSMSSDSIPFFGGELCLGAPYIRGPVVTSGAGAGPCDGQFSTSLDMSFLGPVGFQPGDDLYAQYWYRDPAAVQPVGLSDGIWIGLIQ